MKAEELRIGNYVNRLGDTTVINSISKQNSDNIGYISTHCSGAITVNQIEPIPLTEEWLLRFGFDIRNFNGKTIFWKEDKMYYVDVYKDDKIGFYFMINSIQHSLPLKHVHQLQNLYFALTGEELKIIKIEL